MLRVKQGESVEGLHPCRKRPVVVHAKRMDEPFQVETLEGLQVAPAGAYLMRGVEGEYYPYAKAIFEATYSWVEEHYPHTETRRYGRAELDADLVLSNSHDALAIFGQMSVLFAEFDEVRNVMCYHALSPLFEPVSAAEEPPTYSFSVVDGVVRAERQLAGA